MPEPSWNEVMTGRRTVREFEDRVPPRALVEELIQFAVTAPSASNNQPWRFFVTDKRALIDAMAEAVQVAVDRVKETLEPEALPAFTAYGDYFVRFREAPIVIVPAHRPLALLSQMTSRTSIIERLETTSSLAGTSLAVQNLLLAAHARGLGATCMTGPLLAAPALEGLLGIPEGWHMAVLVALGYAAEEPSPPPRKSLKTVLRWVEKAVE